MKPHNAKMPCKRHAILRYFLHLLVEVIKKTFQSDK
jgi:hypothetical protein